MSDTATKLEKMDGGGSTDVEEETATMTTPVVPVPPKPEPKKRSPFRKREIDRMFPIAELVRVWKRDDAGRYGYCKDYAKRDLEQSGTIEAFIKTYLVPEYGFGEYGAALVQPDGTESERYPITILPPQSAKSDRSNDPGDLLQKVIAAQKELDDRAGRGTSLKDQLESLAMMQQMFGGKDGKGMDIGQFMMMQQMLGAMQPKSQADPVTSTVLQQMLDMMRHQKDRDSITAMMPPPPPITSEEPRESMAEAIRALGDVLKPAPQPPQMTPQDVINLIAQVQPKKEEFGITQLLNMVPVIMPLLDKFSSNDKLEDLRREIERLQKDNPKDDFFTTVRKLREMRTVVQEFGPGAEPESFVGFMRDIVTNVPEMAEAIGDLVVKIKSSELGELDDDEEERKLPDGFDDHLAKIKAAKDDGERIGATLLAFKFLGQNEPWRTDLLKMLNKVRRGQKADLIEFLKSFVNSLVSEDRLSRSIADEVVSAFKKHLDRVIAILTGKRKEKVTDGKEEAKEKAKTEKKEEAQA